MLYLLDIFWRQGKPSAYDLDGIDGANRSNIKSSIKSYSKFILLLLVLLSCIMFWDKSILPASLISGREAKKLLPDDSTSKAAPKNSATGNMFGNQKVRSFSGKRLPASTREYPPIDVRANFTTCQRWGVVTTIFEPTDAVARVANSPSWCLVIVPDLTTPDHYMAKLKALNATTTREQANFDSIFYFSIKKQREWQNVHGPIGKLFKATPWKHFCRKNLGYLFAIMHGAEFIFDFDDDNYIQLDDNGLPVEILPQGKDRTKMKLSNVSVVMQGANAFNHHPIMGASVEDSWPRGFPISLIQNNYTQGEVAYESDLTFATRDKEIGVIQFLADGDPDIDAIHRLTRPLPMTFEGTKSVLVPVHAYTPYNAQATIHTKNAFWALLLPGTVPGRVSDIWRSYFAQCIFADTRLRLVFSPPIIDQKRNAHDYLGDFDAERDLYDKSGQLIEYLSEWDSVSDTIPKRMEDLWIDMYERGYIEIDDVFAVQLWLGALIQAGYKFPPLKRRHRNVAVMGQFNYADRNSTVHDVIFWTQKLRERFDTVAAAGPFSESQMKQLQAHSITVSSYNFDAGYLSPLRNTKDMLLSFKNSTKIKGVLYTHDDGIVNITELSLGKYPFPTDKMMMTDYFDAEFARVPATFGYRAFPDGHTEISAFNKSASFETYDKMFDEFLMPNWEKWGWNHFNTGYCAGGQMQLAKDPSSQRYQESDGSIFYRTWLQSDFAFIPTKYADEFAKAAELHLKHGIWIECAFPKVFDMVRQQTDAQVRTITLCTSWGGARGSSEKMMQNCERSDDVMGFGHPMKISGGYREFSEAYDQLQAAPKVFPKCNPIQTLAQCTAGARNVGAFLTAEECAHEMANASECGDTFMFSLNYPDWGCHCCVPGDKINDSGNANWALYSAHESASNQGVFTCM